MWNSQNPDKPDWANSPTWIAVDETSISYWDSSGKPLGPWSLELDSGNTSPKLFWLHDVSTDERLAEGQWAVGQKELLLRLYPPRTTTSPYLVSIFSKPVNGDLVEFRFEKLPVPPPWLDSDSVGEIAASNDKSSDADTATKTSAADSDLDGRWILDSMYSGPTSIMPEGGTGELMFAGDWLLNDAGDKIIKSLVTTRTDVTPKQIRIDLQLDEGVPIVMHGVYRVDSTSQQSRSLQAYFLMPGVELLNAEGQLETLSDAELREKVRKSIESIPDRCFDEPPALGRTLWRCRRPFPYRRTGVVVPGASEVEGIFLETKQATPDSMSLVEISVGADDGLREGHELSIHRKGPKNGDSPSIHPLGKIQLKLVTPNRAVGIVTLKHQGAIIKKGDSVTALPQ
jgi:hypothetical protein